MEMTLRKIAALNGCTIEQVRIHQRRNATRLEGMADKAAATGKKVNGYTEAMLREMAARKREIAAQDSDKAWTIFGDLCAC